MDVNHHLDGIEARKRAWKHMTMIMCYAPFWHPACFNYVHSAFLLLLLIFKHIIFSLSFLLGRKEIKMKKSRDGNFTTHMWIKVLREKWSPLGNLTSKKKIKNIIKVRSIFNSMHNFFLIRIVTLCINVNHLARRDGGKRIK